MFYKIKHYICILLIIFIMKTCTKCGIEKDESEFYKNHRDCKSCSKEYKSIYYNKNKEKIAKNDKLYKSKTVENQKIYKKKNYSLNSEKYKNMALQWAVKNPEKVMYYHSGAMGIGD